LEAWVAFLASDEPPYLAGEFTFEVHEHKPKKLGIGWFTFRINASG
jgi:hypothetical protein